MDSITFLIPSMMPADVEIIQTELEQIAGVREVQMHQPTHSVTVTWSDPASLDDINRRLLALNFTPDFPQGI